MITIAQGSGFCDSCEFYAVDAVIIKTGDQEPACYCPGCLRQLYSKTRRFLTYEQMKGC